MLDLVIIGSGPAGLTAALYSARAGLSVAVYEKSQYGGALPQISHLANFPGFDGAGADFADSFRSQVIKSGVELAYGECTSVVKQGTTFISTIDGEPVKSRAVLVATGSEPIPLDFTPSVPVSYCALCDAPLYKGKNIIVIGGGNSAVGESLHLASIAKSLTLVSRSKLKADAVFVEKLQSLKNVTIIEEKSPEKSFIDTFDGAFVFIGKRPASCFLDKSLLDKDGYIKSNENKTSISGLFAAGDVRSGSVKQAITAAADGASASIAIANYLKSL